MRPLPDVPSDPTVEPRLELVPEGEEVEETEAEEAEDTAEAEESEDGEDEAKPAAKAEATQDPLKLYVRAIGDGPLLTPRRSVSSRGAKTRATRRPRGS